MPPAISTRPQAIKAVLLGDCTVSTAGFASCTKASPVLELCRLLATAGHGRRALHVYRGTVLALKVRHIGEAAGLQINGKGNGFVKAPAPVCIASSIAQTAVPQASTAPSIEMAMERP